MEQKIINMETREQELSAGDVCCDFCVKLMPFIIHKKGVTICSECVNIGRKLINDKTFDKK